MGEDVTKASWGTKRTCPACGAHFYDLNRHPATCPKCNKQFDPAVAVRVKRKPAKRAAPEENTMALQKALLAKKKLAGAKKQGKKGDAEEGADGIGELMEVDETDDVETLHELSELEEMEPTPTTNEDDADEEALIEDLDTGGRVIVGSVEEEEDGLVQDGEDEQESGKKAAKSVKKKKKKK